ncbi:GNAT family N-acetyltransferase [Paenibacillus solisilvae]|uniref:GNAT family N-acetyltransferase n=1 Tax=Paenibacillus solisilvae TaxID=2486751 RepID=A0ABW0W2W8_9BACL
MSELIKQGNSFVIEENGERAAEITFVPQGEDTLVIDHTFVSEALRGQKIAEALVKRVVDYARETNKMIIPVCSYALSQFKRKKEYHDVWKQ